MEKYYTPIKDKKELLKILEGLYSKGYTLCGHKTIDKIPNNVIDVVVAISMKQEDSKRLSYMNNVDDEEGYGVAWYERHGYTRNDSVFGKGKI